MTNDALRDDERAEVHRPARRASTAGPPTIAAGPQVS